MGFLTFLPLFELGANVALNILSQKGITPANSAGLAVGIEAAVNPFISAIAGKAPTQTEILAGFGALIGSLNAVKQQTGVDPSLLTKVDEYLLAAQDGSTAYIQASKGYDLSLFTVDEPIPAPAA